MKPEFLSEINDLRRKREAVVLITPMDGGEQNLVTRESSAGHPLEAELNARFLSGKSGMVEVDGERSFLTVYVPPPRLVLIGAVHISQGIIAPAQAAGFDVTVIDPRTAFATSERFPNVDLIAEWPDVVLKERPLDAYTALCALTHDPKIDDHPLQAALASECFYVGALGSRKTHAKREDRLLSYGVSEADFSKIASPIGLDIGAASPAEIAVAVLAEVIAALRGKLVAEGNS